MNWEPIRTTAWTILISGGAGWAIAGFVSKRLVEQALNARMERYKSELAQRTEALKVEMSIYAHEHTVTLSRVDAQRSHAISQVYAAMCAWSTPATQLVVGTPLINADDGEVWRHSRENAEKAHAAGKQLSATLVQYAIYLDSTTYEQLATATKRSVEMIAAFLRIIREAEASCQEEETAPQLEIERQKLAVRFQKKIVPLHSEVVAEFRRLLGVDRPRSAV